MSKKGILLKRDERVLLEVGGIAGKGWSGNLKARIIRLLSQILKIHTPLCLLPWEYKHQVA